MRLDIFLKLSRLCPRRKLAQELCEAGFVLLNGKPAKPAHQVSLGDQIFLRRRDHEITAHIMNVPASANVSRRDAGTLIEILSDRRRSPLQDFNFPSGERRRGPSV